MSGSPSIILTTSGVSTSRVATPDYFANPFNVGLQAVVTGTATYNIEYTLDDTGADGFIAATATWTPVSANLTAATTSQNGQLTVPARGIRVNLTAGTGSVALTVQQAGAR